MEALPGLLLPPDVAPGVALLLIGTSFFTSLLTGAMGLGGGVLMLAAIASLLTPAAVIPVHGVVQIGSNLGRMLILRRDVVGRLVLPFALASVAGIATGALFVRALPASLLLAVLGVFILWSCWTPRLRRHQVSSRGFGVVGAATGLLTMFVGGTGPLVAAFLSPERQGRRGVVATHAACMTVQHGLKIGAFTALGFAFLPWLPMLAAMIGSGFLGTMAGTRLLERLPERAFARLFRLVLTVLALRLVWNGAAGLLAGAG